MNISRCVQVLAVCSSDLHNNNNCCYFGGGESFQRCKLLLSIDSDSFLRTFHELYIFLLMTSDKRK